MMMTTLTDDFPPLPDWSKSDFLGGLTPSDIRQELQAYARAAIAAHEAKQTTEPVAYLDIGGGGYLDLGSELSDEKLAELPFGRHMLGIVGTFGVDGYAPAPKREPLTPEQIRSTWQNVKDTGRDLDNAIVFARAIEASHGIKEAP